MKIIEIEALSNGAHRNQSYPGFVPDGWAILPDDVEAASFPFGTVTVAEKDGVPMVTKWESMEVPPPDNTHIYSDIELAQQEITDKDLALIEQGQNITDMELMILEGGM